MSSSLPLVRRQRKSELSGLDPPRPKGPPVSATVLYMSMSLDGFIAGPNETPDNGLGDGGERLHDWLIAESGPEAPRDDEPLRQAIPGGVSGGNRQVVDEFMATGAVVAGRGTVEPAGYWDGDHHDGVPIFIVSRNEPPPEVREMPLVTFVDDVAIAMAEAKRAAGDKGVLVHGAGTTQLALAARVLDELEISVIPVLLGQGRRLFDGLAPEHVELERTRVLQGDAGVTHLHYRVKR
jgi:dihydrofolate reductase